MLLPRDKLQTAPQRLAHITHDFPGRVGSAGLGALVWLSLTSTGLLSSESWQGWMSRWAAWWRSSAGLLTGAPAHGFSGMGDTCGGGYPQHGPAGPHTRLLSVWGF